MTSKMARKSCEVAAANGKSKLTNGGVDHNENPIVEKVPSSSFGLVTVLDMIIFPVYRLYTTTMMWLCGVFSGYVKSMIEQILATRDIKINGSRPQDIRVLNDKFYARIAASYEMGLGESYMEGEWESEHPEEFVAKLLRGNMYKYRRLVEKVFHKLMFDLVNRQTMDRAYIVGQKHYDIGNDLFKSFLDKNMNYSCGYWRRAKDLDQAQVDKMDLIAQKLKLEPGMRVLDIGCGYGTLCKYLAENYGVSVVGVTISVEQVKLGRELCKGLDVDIRLTDYRTVTETFDRIVSVGMFEHVGHKNYREFFQVANRCLVKDGIFLLHTIGLNHKDFPPTLPFGEKYIFPNSALPSLTLLVNSLDGIFITEDLHNFSHYYYLTLMAWHDRFTRNWPTISHKYDQRFYRMWKIYLLACAGLFKCRKVQLWQVVLSKNGLLGGYESVR